MKILMTGSSGLVGTALVASLTQDGHTVYRLKRACAGGSSAAKVPPPPAIANVVDVRWNPTTCDLDGTPFGLAPGVLDDVGAVINLAGASIADESWSAERKAVLRSSRVHTTRELAIAIEKMALRPKVFISASAVGYYGDRGDEVLNEASPPGHDFLSGVAREWECEAVKLESIGLRVVRMRFGIILAKHGGALPRMVHPFRWGAGGKLGSGRQWMPWVTLDDVVAAISYTLDNSSLHGPVNVVSPNPVRNSQFAHELASALHRPAIFPAPAFVLRFFLGEMADALLLSSQRAIPACLEQSGFQFRHPNLSSALASVLS